MKKKEIEMPSCGLYRTGEALELDDEIFPKDRLVMFHNHSNRGIPMLQMPSENINNFWTFHKYGPGIEDNPSFLEHLEPLREQGLYFLKQPLNTPEGIVPRNTLVQLGYNRQANPILFIAEPIGAENGFRFPETGLQFQDASILEILGPSDPIRSLDPDHLHEDEEPHSSGELLQ